MSGKASDRMKSQKRLISSRTMATEWEMLSGNTAAHTRKKNSDHIIPPEKYLMFYLDLRQNVSGSWQARYTSDVAND